MSSVAVIESSVTRSPCRPSDPPDASSSNICVRQSTSLFDYVLDIQGFIRTDLIGRCGSCTGRMNFPRTVLVDGSSNRRSVHLLDDLHRDPRVDAGHGLVHVEPGHEPLLI